MKVGSAKRFLRSRSGATAVEFALVATPFFFMLFSILELGRLFVLSSVLENATMAAGRDIRTGVLQTTGGAADSFRQAVCDRMSIFQGDCDSRLFIDVRVLPQFADPNVPDPTAGEEFSTAGLTFQPGGPQDIVLVRAWWTQSLFTPLLTQGLTRYADGSMVLTAAATFRNEPYQ